MFVGKSVKTCVLIGLLLCIALCIQFYITAVKRNEASSQLASTPRESQQQQDAFDPLKTLARTFAEQFAKYKELHPAQKFAARLPADGKHNVMDIKAQVRDLKYKLTNWTDNGFIFIRITEQYKGNTSQGGSYLYGKVSSAHGLSLCGYDDYFNGTYLVLCPAYSSCVDVDLRAMQINYRHFKQVMEELNILLVLTQFCLDPQQPQKPLKDVWLSINSSWHLNVSPQAETPASYCRSFDTFDRLYMIGASHMRFQFHYLLQTCEKRVPSVYARTIFVDANYAADASLALRHMVEGYNALECGSESTLPRFQTNIETLHKRFHKDRIPSTEQRLRAFAYRKTRARRNPSEEAGQRVNDTEKVVFCRPSGKCKIGVMLQIGSWDLCFNGLNKTLSDVIPVLDEALHATAQAIETNTNVRFLLMAPPPFNPQGYRYGRSNTELLIFNDVLARIAAKYPPLRFFDNFGLMYPRYTANVDTHYLRCQYGQERGCQGEMGKTVAQAALAALSLTHTHTHTLTHTHPPISSSFMHDTATTIHKEPHGNI